MKRFQTSSSGYFLFLMFLIGVINYLDRQVLGIVQDDIKADLRLTDTQLGYLSLAFGLVHAFFALPIGRLGDRTSRKGVLVGCMTLWSSMTMVTGTIGNFFQLVVTRMGVALGESGVTPTTYSMMADKFPLTQRARAISAIVIGMPIGLMLSNMLGGIVATEVGWRWTFVLFGLPGILLAIVFTLTIKPPKQGESDGVKKVKHVGFFEGLGIILSVPSYRWVWAGAVANSLLGYGLLQWLPSYMRRAYDLTRTETGIAIGLIIGIAGLLGTLIGAYVADRLAGRDLRWYSWIIAICYFASFPCFFFAFLTGNYDLAMVLMTGGLFFGFGAGACVNALIQSTTPIQVRGMSAALKTWGLSFLGYGVGGWIIGRLSDHFDTGVKGEGLGQALLYMSVFAAVAGVCFLLSTRTLRQDIQTSLERSRA